MTKRLKLSGANPLDLFALVDDEDFEQASTIRWYPHHAKRSQTVYAKGGVGLFLHRFVIDAEKGQIVDHIDGDGLNCTRANLRFLTHSENMKAATPRTRKRRIAKAFDEWENRL